MPPVVRSGRAFGLEVCWLDEESPEDLYFEALTRTNETGGIVYSTFYSNRRPHQRGPHVFAGRNSCMSRAIIVATIDDALHFTDEQRAEIIASYPAHEREARTKGIPSLGSGRIFPIAEETIAVDHRTVPSHWPRIGGMDFGWDHSFAAVELVWDRDSDVVYVSRTHRLTEATPVLHAAALKAWGNFRWAWPSDGRRETLEGAGIALAQQYSAQGLEMLHEHAQFEDGSVSVEAGLMDMLDRMQTGRFKVFKELNDWWEEFRLYHRKDGRVVKEGDDLMAATRYALMMLRHARTEKQRRDFHRVIEYPELGRF
jgi:Terminase RNaseH-like domain/Terminase large subunit, T4likevirus-type, N-terminal